MPIDTGDVWVRWLLAGCPAEQRKEGVRTIERFAREYRAQTLSIDEFEDWQMRFLAGFDREFLEKARLDYKREVLEAVAPRESLRAARLAKSEGAVTALCTATYRFAVEPSAEIFGLDHVLATLPEEDASGRFTGRWVGPMTYQAGKVTAVKALVGRLAKEGIEIEAFEFWADSAADLPLFEFVHEKGGVCHVVNANETMREKARLCGWDIGRTYTDDEEKAALSVVAKALAKRENSSH